MSSGKLTLIPAFICLCVLAGCGSSSDEQLPSSASSDGSGAEMTEQVRVFATEGEQFDPVEHEVPAHEAPLAATRALLNAPADRTFIPKGTTVKDVRVTGDGEATVKLSDEFLGDIPPNPAARNRREKEAVEGRVAQVTYTLTSLGNVQKVRVQSGGITVASKDRADFAEPKRKPQLPGRGESTGPRSTGTRVLQQQLADLGYLPQSGVDGELGYQTEQAVMAFQSWEGLDRDGVAGPLTRASLAKAKRPRPSARRPNRLMEVRVGKGVLLLARNGRAVRTIHISAGGPGNETPTGRFEVFRKELQSWSVPFSTWLPYASYFNNGIAFHEYPDVPPYPASHGCVRVPAPEAPLVYRFARMGTTVVVRS